MNETPGTQSKTARNGTQKRARQRIFLTYDLPIHIDIQLLPETLQRTAQADFRGLTVKRDREGWFVILKATRRGQHVCHFTGGRTWADAMEVLLYEIQHGTLSWKQDKYANED